MFKIPQKIKKFFTPDWAQLYQSFLQNLLWVVVVALAVAGSGIWLWLSKLDPLELRARLNQAFAGFLYLLTAFGAATVLYLISRLWLRLHPSMLMVFVWRLDEATKGKSISGPGRLFLNQAKALPPFLGMAHAKPVLPLEYERTLTELFEAQEFFAKNAGAIRGGNTFQAQQGDTWEIAAKREYGDERFSKYLMAANNGFLAEPLSRGGHYTRPFVDISESLGLSPEHIQAKYDIVADKFKAFRKAFGFLLNDLHLTSDEAIPLLSWVYEAARLTLGEKR